LPKAVVLLRFSHGRDEGARSWPAAPQGDTTLRTRR